MRVIAIEEHFTTAGLDVLGPGRKPEVAAKLSDLGTGRIAEMDAAGIDMQVLSASAPGTQGLAPAEAVVVACAANDALADAVAEHPDRFAGFAILPIPNPAAAVAELERCVKELHFKGAMIHGHTKGRFLDAPEFAPILECAEALDVPIYLHPTPPPPEVFAAYFGDLPAELGATMAGAGWGWHAETGLHSLRLVVAGVFDRYPNLKVIIGHMGENIPFSLARADASLSPVASHLQRRVAEYFTENFYVTTSAYFTVPPFACAVSVLGIDRLLFSVDHPFSSNAEGRSFLDSVPVSPADREKLAHGNAERLLRL